MAPLEPASAESASTAYLLAKQAWPSAEHADAFEGGASARVAAEAFLAALSTPVMLEWHAMLQDGTSAVMSAELSNKWPLPKVSLKFVPANGGAKYKELGVAVPTSASVEQLTELIFAAMGGDDSSNENLVHEAAATEALPTALAPLPRVAADEERRIFQPTCLYQWHHDICGHHALFNARCLLLGEVQQLQDAHCFWQRVLGGVSDLAEHGESSKRWPRSRVMGGIADGVHLRHLVDADSQLRGRVTVVESSEVLNQRLQDPEAEVRIAMDAVAAGQGAHAFLLGATNHWYAAVAVGALPEKGGPVLWFCDSYNKPLVCLQSDNDLEDMLEKRMSARWTNKYEQLKQRPEWMHRPEEDINAAVQDGVQEWWKGKLKSSLFWRDKPFELTRQLLRQELLDVRAYMDILISALKLPPSVS